MSKTILFLSHYFPPEVNAPANRTYEHCKIWAKKGKVIVVTNFPNHPAGKLFSGYKNRFHQKEIIEGIEVHRLLTYITANEGFLLRTFNYVFYMIASVFFIVFANLKFDVIIATTPQFFCGLAGKYIAKIKKKPFILELRDIWPESILAVGAIKSHIVIRFLERLEIGLYRASDKIVSVTKSFKANLLKKGVDEDKIEVMYNGVSKEFFDDNKMCNKEIEEYLSEGFCIGYIGTIGMAHSIETLIHAAFLLKNTDVKFLVVGSGAEEEKVRALIKELKLENIKLFPLQPKSEVPAIISKLDMFCVHLKNTPLFQTVIPSKIFEGMIMRKPILMGVKGEALEILEKANCCISFEPENHKDLAEKVLMYKENKQLLGKLGDNGYNYVTQYFDRTHIANDFYILIQSVLVFKD